jgi:hypothetical protein
MRGYWVNEGWHPTRQDAQQALACPAYGTSEARLSRRGDGAEFRADAGEIEVIIDGIRHCEDPRTGKWRPCAELELEVAA